MRQTHLIVKKTHAGMLMHIFAVCTGTQAEAQAMADNANEWYGEGHPLTPLVVMTDGALLDPTPFPVEAMRPGGNIASIFDNIDED